MNKTNGGKNVGKYIFIHVFGVDTSLVFFAFDLMRWFCAMAESMCAYNVHCIRLNTVMINNEKKIHFVYSSMLDGLVTSNRRGL